MRAAAGTGAIMGAGKTTIREWIRSGRFHPVIFCASIVSQSGDGALSGQPAACEDPNERTRSAELEDFVGRLERRQGRRTSSRNPHRLDPDGWLVRFHIDTEMNESPAA